MFSHSYILSLLCLVLNDESMAKKVILMKTRCVVLKGYEREWKRAKIRFGNFPRCSRCFYRRASFSNQSKSHLFVLVVLVVLGIIIYLKTVAWWSPENMYNNTYMKSIDDNVKLTRFPCIANAWINNWTWFYNRATVWHTVHWLG